MITMFPLTISARRKNTLFKSMMVKKKKNLLLHETTNSTGPGRIWFLFGMNSKTDMNDILNLAVQ